jgi:hypothetical protein
MHLRVVCVCFAQANKEAMVKSMQLMTQEPDNTIFNLSHKNWTKEDVRLTMPSLEAVLVTVLLSTAGNDKTAESEAASDADLDDEEP